MFRDKKIGVVIPCFNEEQNLSTVVHNLPDFIDAIIIINDASTDRTLAESQILQKDNCKILIVNHAKNRGVGAAIKSGYRRIIEENCEISVVMAGDNQMDPIYLKYLILPIANGSVDFMKTTRTKHESSSEVIPKIRIIGNAVLTILTKIVSGYWSVNDCQSGYVAVNTKILRAMQLDSLYEKYGQPNDFLILMNIVNARIGEILTPPRYNVGEKSKMKIWKLFFTLPCLFFRRFHWRIYKKYKFYYSAGELVDEVRKIL